MAATAAKASTESNIRQTYRSHTHEEHIYEVPDTYIGSAEKDRVVVPVLNSEQTRILEQELEIVPGLFKVFDEVLVNALDQHTRLAGMSPTPPHIVSQIKVTADEESGMLSVYNDGMGIDIIEHPDQKVFVPEMIFGKLLTSTNYDKEEKRFTGGKNGYGAKLANIFAKKFTVETVDHTRGKKYTQVWSDNMKVVGKPKITDVAPTTKPYTKITWLPDYTRFGLADGLTNDMVRLFHRRTLDCAAWCGASVKVYWNGSMVPCRNILQYAKLVAGDTPVVSLKGNEHWEVLIGATSPGESFRQVSFVNGIHTSNGGRHVAHVQKQVVDAIQEAMKKKLKKEIRPAIIRDAMFLIVKCMIVNPSFKSQTKDELTTPATKMGTKWTLDPKDVAVILSKTNIAERLTEAQSAEDIKEAKKTDGKKKSRITGIPKLEDATNAGTRESEKCTLILTEGDSAATTAISGLKVVGRDYYGVFPLKGKMINAKNASDSNLNDNTEIQNIKKILGLESGRKYTDLSSLRYGKVMIMTDQDHDGSHIKGLVMNMFHSQWPELLKLGFIVSMLTPIVKAFKGADELSFYTLYDYEQWKLGVGEAALGRWRVKYYKGLGTSTASEAREYFRSLRGIKYDWTDDSAFEMDKAFMKGKENDRKRWISEYEPSNVLQFSAATPGEFTSVPIPDFINRELIAYSHASNLRAIPNLMDGLKVSQRKILFGCLKRDLRSEVRVAQLAGYVSEHSAYHHGEASLNQTIIAMAQTFVGSNNINILEPIGQFGSRLMGGDDASSPRYIHTHLTKIAHTIFRKEDVPVLKYLDDDGLPVEPEWYAPVIPMVLVNGCRGIATGYTTYIPPYMPDQLVAAIRDRIRPTLPGKASVADPRANLVLPWWRGFGGNISKETDHKYLVQGIYRVLDENTVEITELPVGTWTKMYREFLETLLDKSPMCKKSLLKDIRDEYNDLDVKFTLEFLPGILSPLVSEGKLSKVLDLDTAIHTNNMWLYDSRGRLRRYNTAEEIMDEFVVERLRLYAERKDAILRELRREHTMISAKALFIKLVCEDIIDIRGSDDSKLAEVLRENELPELDKSSGLATRDVLAGWKYLMILPVRTLTPTKREQLLKEVGELEAKISTIEASTVQSMWEADLVEFEEAYKDYLKERDSADNDVRNEIVVKKTSVKRSRNTKLHTPPVASGAGVSLEDD